MYLWIYDTLETEWPLPADTFDIPTSFGSTHGRRSGVGERTPMVLLHPVNGSSLYWRSVVADLARDREVYALDTIGTAGRSVQTAPLRGEADVAVWQIREEHAADRGVADDQRRHREIYRGRATGSSSRYPIGSPAPSSNSSSLSTNSRPPAGEDRPSRAYARRRDGIPHRAG
ncbi:hypothetical protein SAMN05421776_101190 [Nocardia farcinica]|uniref:Carboxylesterase ybfK n=1 Tax=Nocardia farcinica TaxID=37329 RepID=A0A0H5NHX1_NOCFR|nr:hypothetical protein [Nocardia farcinica]AXK84435.1 hypothetical protein DXT66_01155 [Nocardia farcinica]CRY74767.1 Carboxylesterase ybfK [Nocardia farcinica]SIS60477.1 hypothetical protein SAMN05421776_101190 [Nocardia farcinica]